MLDIWFHLIRDLLVVIADGQNQVLRIFILIVCSLHLKGERSTSFGVLRRGLSVQALIRKDFTLKVN